MSLKNNHVNKKWFKYFQEMIMQQANSKESVNKD